MHNAIHDITEKVKDPKWLYDNYFKGSDSNITLKDLQRMRGVTILMNEKNADGALLYGLLTL